EAGKVDVAIIDRSVRRALELKFRLGLFENPYPDRNAISKTYDSNQKQHNALSYKLAQESIVLIKNEDNLLPLPPQLAKVAVIGPNARVLRNVFGGYSYSAAVELKYGIGSGQEGVEIDR